MTEANPRSYHLEKLVLGVVFSIYFFPGFRVSEGLILRLDDIVLLSVFPLLFLYRPLFFSNTLSRSLLVCLLVVIFSTCYGYLFLEVPYSSRDFNEIIRLSKPFIFIILLLSCDTQFLVSRVSPSVIPLSWLLVLIGFVQYFNLGGVGAFVGSLYAPPHHVANMVGNSHRILLVGSDPNVGAAIVLMFFLYNLFNSFINKSLNSKILTFLMVILVLMTSSRTSFIALALIITIFLFTSKSLKILPKILFSFLIIFMIVSLYEQFSYIAIGFAVALQGENTSLLNRFEKWMVAWELFLQSPIFGWGLAKASMETTVDGEYILLLRRFGVVGTVIISALIFLMPFWKNKIKLKSPRLMVIELTLKYYVIVIFFIMLTNSFFSGYQLFIPYVFLSVILYKERLKIV